MSTTEQWLPVVGWPDYSVSNLGRVMSHKRVPARVIRGRVADGYQRVQLSVPGAPSKDYSVHSLVAAAFIGPRPEGMEIRHLDGNRLNNVVSNLRYGTKSENVRDAVMHGTHSNTRKTHCKYGHPFDVDNTYVIPSTGNRGCRTCRRAYAANAALRAASVPTLASERAA